MNLFVWITKPNSFSGSIGIKRKGSFLHTGRRERSLRQRGHLSDEQEERAHSMQTGPDRHSGEQRAHGWRLGDSRLAGFCGPCAITEELPLSCWKQITIVRRNMQGGWHGRGRTLCERAIGSWNERWGGYRVKLFQGSLWTTWCLEVRQRSKENALKCFIRKQNCQRINQRNQLNTQGIKLCL